METCKNPFELRICVCPRNQKVRGLSGSSCRRHRPLAFFAAAGRRLPAAPSRRACSSKPLDRLQQLGAHRAHALRRHPGQRLRDGRLPVKRRRRCRSLLLLWLLLLLLLLLQLWLLLLLLLLLLLFLLLLLMMIMLSRRDVQHSARDGEHVQPAVRAVGLLRRRGVLLIAWQQRCRCLAAAAGDAAAAAAHQRRRRAGKSARNLGVVASQRVKVVEGAPTAAAAAAGRRAAPEQQQRPVGARVGVLALAVVDRQQHDVFLAQPQRLEQRRRVAGVHLLDQQRCRPGQQRYARREAQRHALAHQTLKFEGDDRVAEPAVPLPQRPHVAAAQQHVAVAEHAGAVVAAVVPVVVAAHFGFGFACCFRRRRRRRRRLAAVAAVCCW